MRPIHILKGNKGTSLPTRCLFVDSETKEHRIDANSVQATPWLIGVDWRRRRSGNRWTKPAYQQFTSVRKFWKYVDGRTIDKTRTYLFAHNLGFDLQVTRAIPELKRLGWTLTRMVMEDPPTVFTFRRDTRSLVLVDSMNYYQNMSLKMVGEHLGIEKLDMPVGAPPRVWADYLRRDVEILAEAMLSWFRMVREWDLGNFAQTLPAQAFSAYRHRFMPQSILIDDHSQSLEMARRAYVGGRVEVFRLGETRGPLYVLDVNSLYPFVMRDQLLPYRLVSVYKRPDLDEIERRIGERFMVADVTVETDEPIYPAKHEGRLVFPVGRFRTYLAGAELVHAMRAGHVLLARRVAVYHQELLFTAYVEFFARKRLEARRRSDEAGSLISKLFLNSLSGKFGQRGRHFKEQGQTTDDAIKTWTEYDLDDDTSHHMRQVGGLIQELHRGTESHDSYPALAAGITSAGRLHLWRLIESAGRENVYYVDTDSVLVSQTGMDRLGSHLDADAVGALKIEKIIDVAQVRGLKDKTLDGVRSIKGVRPNAKEVSEGVFVQESFRGLRGAVLEGEIDRQIITITTKHLDRTYRKGIVHNDGRVSPMVLGSAPSG